MGRARQADRRRQGGRPVREGQAWGHGRQGRRAEEGRRRCRGGDRGPGEEAGGQEEGEGLLDSFPAVLMIIYAAHSVLRFKDDFSTTSARVSIISALASRLVW